MILRPFRLAGREGSLAAIYYAPAGEPHPLGDVLLAPAFAEEMNRCRSMVALQARELARRGIGTLILDPYGTGDSAGEFSDGSWALWRDDLRRGIEWLRGEGPGCRTVWGVRLGALMAAELAAADPGIERLLLWQPVVDGRAFYTQFLRIRIAAELEQSGGLKTTDELRRSSAQGEIIEVSGYPIGPDLSRELDGIALPPPAQLAAVHTQWIEVLPAADSSAPRANTKAVDAYRQAGIRLDFECAIGPAFWQVHERVVAPELVLVTNRLLFEGAGSPAVSGGTAGAHREPAASGGVASAPDDPQSAVLAPRAARASAGAAATAGEPAEYGITFPCASEQLMGVVHRGGGRRGVVIVVAGGPQYRAGAHRQFTALARKLAALGHPVLRFDLRGMGDSGGDYLGFQHSVPDIRAAIDALIAHQPSVHEVVLFGECESASGILFYAYRDVRVSGIALVNPWVRTEGGRAEVIIKHYYASRLLSGEFWRKVARGRFNPLESLRDLAATARAYLEGRGLRRQTADGVREEQFADLPLPVKTAVGLRQFRGPVLILMSGRDYIAREFDEVVKSSKAWAGLLSEHRVCRRDLAEADHTFSRRRWKRQATDWVCQWVASW